ISNGSFEKVPFEKNSQNNKTNTTTAAIRLVKTPNKLIIEINTNGGVSISGFLLPICCQAKTCEMEYFRSNAAIKLTVQTSQPTPRMDNETRNRAIDQLPHNGLRGSG